MIDSGITRVRVILEADWTWTKCGISFYICAVQLTARKQTKSVIEPPGTQKVKFCSSKRKKEKKKEVSLLTFPFHGRTFFHSVWLSPFFVCSVSNEFTLRFPRKIRIWTGNLKAKNIRKSARKSWMRMKVLLWWVILTAVLQWNGDSIRRFHQHGHSRVKLVQAVSYVGRRN